MSDKLYHHVIVRRAVIGKKPFIWEIQHNHSRKVVRRSARSFVSLAEAHLAGTAAIVDGRWRHAGESVEGE